MLQSYSRGNAVTIKFDNEFNHKSFHCLKKVYNQAEEGSEFILDLGNVKRIDSSAIGAMLMMRESLPESQDKITCINCQPNILEIFEFSNLVKLFNFPQYEKNT